MKSNLLTLRNDFFRFIISKIKNIDSNKILVFKLNLRVKIIAMIFLFISVPVILLGVYSYRMSETSLQSTSEQSMKLITLKTKTSIEEKISVVKDYINMVSHNELLLKALDGGMQEKIAAYQYMMTIQQDNEDTINSLTLINMSGKGITNNENPIIDEDYTNVDYVKKALTGSLVESDVMILKQKNKKVVAFVYPIMKDYDTKGALVGIINFDKFTQLISEIKIGQKGYAYLIDSTGKFIYHPDSKKILKENVLKTSSGDYSKMIKKMLDGKAGTGFYDYEGHHNFVNYTPVGNWGMVLTDEYNDYMASAINIKNTTIIIIIVFLIVFLGLSTLFIIKNIISPINKLQVMMHAVGDGDLSIRADIRTGDEIESLGVCFNDMLIQQTNIVKNILSVSNELSQASQNISSSALDISSSSEQITASSQQVTENAEHQNSAVLEISEVIVQLSSLIQLAQNKALKANASATETKTTAKDGRNKVVEAVASIENIDKVTIDTEESLRVLTEISSKVGGIINTINNISSQTNLLALNAAIEAARAGEYGRGFSVVADQIRILSQQTSQGAKNISTLINEMLNQINITVELNSINKNAVTNGVSIIKETDVAFISIITAVEKIGEEILNIVDVTKEEVASSEQVLTLIDSIATIAEATAESSKEVTLAAESQSAVTQSLAAQAEETNGMAVNFHEIVEKFKI